MYPHEIVTTSIWIRHNLPLSASPPLNGDEKLRQQIRSQNAGSTDEMIEHYVRQERARLDLKWCLDEFFAWNIPNPFLGQLVVANLFGHASLAYIIDISPVNITVAPVDMIETSVVIGFDDIYSAENSPFYEKFVLNHHLLHSQHVLDFIANQKRQDELKRLNYNVLFNTTLQESTSENFEIEWPEGEETWLIDDKLPQYSQFVTFKQEVTLPTLILNSVGNSVQETPTVSACVTSSLTQPSHDIMLLLEESLVKQNALQEQNILLKEEVAKHKVIVNEFVLILETIENTRISYEVKLPQELQLITSLKQPTTHLIMSVAPDLKHQGVKQFQCQQSDQLIKYPPLSESYLQYVFNGITAFSYGECGYSDTKILSLPSLTISLNDSLNSYNVQLVPLGIILLTFMFLSFVFANLSASLIFCNDTVNSYLVNKLVLHGINNFEWFRTLAEP